jgi:uncharacterized protein (TIGR00297 family)
MVISSVLSKKIDLAGGLLGGLFAYLLYAALGWLGVFLIGGFFVLGTAASLWKIHQKAQRGVAEAHNGQRGWRNVAGNAGVAAGLVLPVLAGLGSAALAEILIAACFAAALSDTWSSELGNVYGTRFYEVLTGKPGRRGRDGVVSWEGSLAGVAGSVLVALLYGLSRGWGSAVVIISVAGLLGNLTDSLLGATLERSGKLGNHGVNFLATLAAALIALGLFFGEKLLHE